MVRRRGALRQVSALAGSAEELTVQMEVRGDWVIVRVAGELDLMTLPLLNSRLDLAGLLRDPPLVAVELSQMRFCDSTGVGLLVRMWKSLRARGGNLVLVRPAAQMRQLLKRTGLDRVFSIRAALPIPALG